MTMHCQMTVSLGDLVAAVFDEAATYVSEPGARARLATRAVRQMLRQGEHIDHQVRAGAHRTRRPPAPRQIAVAS